MAEKLPTQHKYVHSVKPIAGTVTPEMPYNRGLWDGLYNNNGGALRGNLSALDKYNLVYSGISSLLNAGSIYAQGVFEAKQLEINAMALEINKKALDRDIKDISYITGVNASNVMKTSAELKGKQMAAQAEANFSVTETESFVAQRDYTDLLAQDQINQYAYEAAMAIEGKRNQQAAIRAEQAIKRAEAKYIKKTAKAAAGMQIVSGATNIATGIYL